MRPIDERTVLVTRATSGLGRQLVQRPAGAGATVIAHGRCSAARRIYQRDPRCDQSAATTSAHA
jgi:NAD(P)-dependent dehydrogenase (short-subunit alcohol dehydrogenase family)